MELSDTSLFAGLMIVLAAIILVLGYIAQGVLRQRRLKKQGASQKQYQWKPETDYHVIERDGGPMTPPSLELLPKERLKAKLEQEKRQQETARKSRGDKRHRSAPKE